MQDKNGSIVNLLPDIIYRIDTDGNFTYLNRAVRCLGYEPEELLSKHFSTIIHPEDLENIQRSMALKKMGNGGAPAETPKLFDERRTGKRITRDLPVRLVPKQGAATPAMEGILRSNFSVMSVGSYDKSPGRKKRRFLGTLGVIRPDAAAEPSDESAARSMQYYRTLVENASDIVSILATDGTVLFASPSITLLLGYSPGDFAGTGIWDYIHPDDAMEAAEAISSSSALDPRFAFDCRFRDGSGSWRKLRSSGRMVFDAGGDLLCMIVTSRDITAQAESEASLQRAFEYMEHRVLNRTADLVRVNNRLKAEIEGRRKEEAKFSESDSKYRSLVNSIDDIVFNVDSDGVILYVNQAVEKVTGHDPRELIGHNILAHVHPDDGEGLTGAFQKAAGMHDAERVTAIDGVCESHECRMVRRDGSPVWLEMRYRPVTDADGAVQGYRGIAVDITRRKRTEEELLRSSKIESMSILAGGLAHDFNNLLTSIIGNISLVKRILEREGGHEENISSLSCAESASGAARDLAIQLLAFAKGGAPVIRSTSIRSLLMDTAHFVLSGSPIQCVFSLPDRLCDAEIDRTQISQVIHNIVLNARQAMPGGGTLSIAAEEVRIGPGSDVPLRPGKYIMISIADRGGGIPPDIMQKIFDPYFTTKESGTGLGLSISYSIMKKHDGYIAVRSEEGAGAVFTLYLPASKKKRGRAAKRPARGRVLFADDDCAILSVGERLMRTLGYAVTCVRGGQKAFDEYAAARDRGEPYDIVIIDLSMPGGMKAERIAGELKGLDPDAKVIVTSGHVSDLVMTDFAKHGLSGSLAKPFDLGALEEELKRVMRG